MAKKDNLIEEVVQEVKEEVKEIVPVILPTPVKRFTFEQWAGNRMIKEHHKSGLRVFCGNPDKLRTMEDWDKAFKDY